MCDVKSDSRAPDTSITTLLARLSEGDREAEERLISQVYAELKRLAGNYMRQERGNHTLEPTALVHEAYLRLMQENRVPWHGRAHFFATASRVMRHILVDHARARTADRRGGVQTQVTLSEILITSQNRSIDVLALDEAMERLTTFDARQGRIVELHFFGGLTFEEIGFVLSISDRTVKRDWGMARAWLRIELSKSV
jgi:RNA polymerase sigma factor (TIGR02999 family)